MSSLSLLCPAYETGSRFGFAVTMIPQMFDTNFHLQSYSDRRTNRRTIVGLATKAMLFQKSWNMETETPLADSGTF